MQTELFQLSQHGTNHCFLSAPAPGLPYPWTGCCPATGQPPELAGHPTPECPAWTRHSALTYTYMYSHTHNVFTHPPTPTCIHPTPTLTPACIHPPHPYMYSPPQPHMYSPPKSPPPHVFTPSPTCIHSPTPPPHVFTCPPIYTYLHTHLFTHPPTHVFTHQITFSLYHAVLNKIQVNINNTYSY